MLKVRLVATALLAAALCGFLAISTAAGGTAKPPPYLSHVFVIVLENEDSTTSWGPTSEAPYLAKTLRSKGEYLPNYHGIGHSSLDNYIAMISGQAPTPQTQADCGTFANFTPATPSSGGQYKGTGCVYPRKVKTVANQLEDSGHTWRGYMQDMANGGAGVAKTCRHPAIGAADPWGVARVGDQYATKHNPFMYFHSVIDYPTCAKNDVDLSKLPSDLKAEKTTPDYSFITPNLCDDGHDHPCVDGQPGGLKSANGYLKTWVPMITRSPAFKDRGLLLITFDEALTDSSACCGEKPGPNIVPPNTPGGGRPGPGGGKIGALVLSPCVKAGSVTKTPFNHYSMLRSVEDNFGLKHLGYAGQKGLVPFGTKVLNKPSC